LRTNEQLLLNISGYPDYHEVLVDSTGTRIALSIYKAGKDSPCIVFLPGTMTHPLLYDDFLSLLAGNGFSVAGIHFLSHGKSPREKKLYSFQDMLQNVSDAITYCRDNISTEIILMGSSQGGILSIAAACIDDRIKAVFPHNILLPDLPGSIDITSFPHFLKPFSFLLKSAMRLGARVWPSWQIPVTFYLDFDRVSRSAEVQQLFYTDPIGLTSYPLFFLSSLFNADLSKIKDGSIKCPVVVIASKQDTLFPYSYCQEVFDLIAAPHKDMLTFDEPYHLIFNECPERVIGPIVEKLKKYC
jgi:alpha-beta hydrolase superfamily lysophospholipase